MMAKLKIDVGRYERYLSLRNLFEFLARAATTPIPPPAGRPDTNDPLFELLDYLSTLRAEGSEAA
jgi:hypothetical protein